MPEKNFDSYANNIYKIFKRDYPQLNIKRKAVRAMDDLISQILVDLKKRSLELTHVSNKKILKERAVKYAIQLELPSLLSRDSILAAAMASMRHDASVSEIELPKLYHDLAKELPDKYTGFIKADFVVGKKSANSPVKLSDRVGLSFDIARVRRHLKLNNDNDVGDPPALGVAAAMEIITMSVLHEAVKQMKTRKTLKSRDIMIGIYKNDELCKLFKNFVIMDSGVPL